VFNNSSLVEYAFVAEVKFLPSRCLAMIRGCTTYRHTQTDAIEMNSSSVIYIPNFTDIRSGIQKSIEGIYREEKTQRAP
jgi:hypothetical protein